MCNTNCMSKHKSNAESQWKQSLGKKMWNSVDREHFDLGFCSALQSQMSALSKSVNTCLSLCESLSVTVPSARELSGSAVWAGSSKALLPSQRFPHCPFLITEESLASVLSHSAHRTKKSQLIINVIKTYNCWSCTQHLTLRIVNRPASSYV